MYKLRKIKELKGFRFFQNFRWDETNCDLFNRNNLIYGWNGSGKTTLCDFFKELEEGHFSSTTVTFSLLFENTDSKTNCTVSKNNLGSIPYIFKVFHQGYINENISTVDNIKHIFSVGKEQAEKIDEVKRLKAEAKKYETEVKSAENDLNTLQQSFDQVKTAKAKYIKDAAQYTNAYNKNRFYSAYQSLSNKHLLSEIEYQNAMTAVRSEKRPLIDPIRKNFIQSTVKEYISEILRQTPVNITIESLKQDSQMSNWVERGLRLHEEKGLSTCIFCGNPVSENRFEELRKHFNKSYRDLSDKIDSAVILLQDKIKQFDNVKTTLPDAGLLYLELREQYIPLQKNAIDTCDKYIEIIAGIIDILIRKKSDMINPSYTDEFVILVENLSFDYSLFESISAILDTHNGKTLNFNNSIESAKKAIETHLLSEFSEEIASWENNIKNKDDELEKKKKAFELLKQRITLLEKEIKNSQIPADAINKDIEFIMGRNELVFSNRAMGYQITRRGEIAKNLSKGEENAIALVYFFNTLLDINADAQNTIIVLDDPISSFDSNFYYNAISYIREKTGQAGQTFIFTHKFSLLKDYSLMYKGETSRYTIQRIHDSPQLTNEDKMIGQYHDEYAYLFKKIYWFVKSPPADTSEYLQYPNMARRLLEGFLTFKLPLPNDQCSMLDKVLKLEEGKNTVAGRSILRLLNNHSHLRVIQDGDFTDNIDNITILPNILIHLLAFMKHHDADHYNTLALLCDPDYKADGDAIKINKPILRKIKLYEMPASAGPGNFMDGAGVDQDIEVENSECSFAVRISGDSMEPRIADGSIVLVKQCEEVPNAHTGIVLYNGSSYCKKIVQKDNQLLLVSSNKAYKPITVENLDEFRIFGEVVDVIKSKM